MNAPDDIDNLMATILKSHDDKERVAVHETRSLHDALSIPEKDALFAYAAFGKIMTGAPGVLIAENADESMDYMILPGDETKAVYLLTRLINRLTARIAARRRGE